MWEGGISPPTIQNVWEEGDSPVGDEIKEGGCGKGVSPLPQYKMFGRKETLLLEMKLRKEGVGRGYLPSHNTKCLG